MSGETLGALLWLLLSSIGVLISVRAAWRGWRRLGRSEDPVARAVHLAELITGILFFLVFSMAVVTVLTSLVFLPPLEGATGAQDAYSRFRTAVVRWELVAQKVVELFIVFVPEILDRRLTRLAGRSEREPRDGGHSSETGLD